jgi:hypothetical protein
MPREATNGGPQAQPSSIGVWTGILDQLERYLSDAGECVYRLRTNKYWRPSAGA